jgi:bifunctional non-homologous end joining protein LigD
MAKPKTLPYEAGTEEVPYMVELHSTAGGSDKIYRLTVEASGAGWLVNYANGRRGGTLATGTRTPTPVDYAAARKDCNNKLFEQVGKGYVPIAGSRFGDGHAAEAIATIAKAASGHIPQLLSAIDAETLERLIRDDRFVAEVKHDGERRMLIVEDGMPTGGNRQGQTVALPAKLRAAASAFPDVVLDGEQIGDTLHVWDILSYKGIDLRSRPLHQRQKALDAGDFFRPGLIVRTETAVGEEAKRKLLAQVRASSGEGLVFKLRDALYDPGKPGGQASWYKFKFWNSLSAIVEGAKKGRSVNIKLLDEDGSDLPMGGVTIPANHAIPEKGAVVDVRYLYAFPQGALHQPVYSGPRPDLTPADCLASQRSFKAVAEPAQPEAEDAEADAPAAPGM